MAFAVNVAARTQSLPAGAALFNYRTRPALRGNENVAIPDITLAVKLVPIGVVITPDISALPGERRRWPKFHSGVAAALSQRVDDPEGYDNSDIAFNKPASDLDSRHAGYLFGLGLTGQIRSMAVFQAFSYLDPKHELTSIGVLLGLSSAFIGTADPKVSSVLAVHLSALHPAGSAELNITLLTQSAAMLGVGLLHMSTRRRSMADTVLRELPRIVLRNKEHSESCREAYALSAGFAFGMIMLAHGGDGPGPADESLLRKFKALIDGDGQNPLPGSNGNTGNGVDVSTTAPAAIVALSLMFLDADRADVLDLLQLPHSEACLDYIRPDLILMRTIGRCLIQLSKIQPTVEYVNSQLPEFVLKAAKRFDETGSFSSMDLEVTYWSIVGGICFAIGLRFAGTGSVQVHTLLSGYLTTLYRPLNVRSESAFFPPAEICRTVELILWVVKPTRYEASSAPMPYKGLSTWFLLRLVWSLPDRENWESFDEYVCSTAMSTAFATMVRMPLCTRPWACFSSGEVSRPLAAVRQVSLLAFLWPSILSGQNRRQIIACTCRRTGIYGCTRSSRAAYGCETWTPTSTFTCPCASSTKDSATRAHYSLAELSLDMLLHQFSCQNSAPSNLLG